MSRNDKFRSDKLAGKSFPSEIDDPIVAGALKHFKASVDAWSEAAYSRPKSMARTTHHTWRLTASWALGCLLIAGSLTGGLYERHQRLEAARTAEIKATEQKVRLAAEQRVTPLPVATSIATKRTTAVKRAANTDEDLLATVDSDVSRQVPAAMEPLAQMIEGDGSN